MQREFWSYITKRELDEIYVIYTKMENLYLWLRKNAFASCYREQFEKNRPPIDISGRNQTDTSVKEVLEHIVPNV